MGKKRKRDLYKDTSDRRTFKIIHIINQTDCCLKCERRRSNKWYHIDWSIKKKNVFPNWKLVSKNKKQWMNKPIVFEQKENSRWITINW